MDDSKADLQPSYIIRKYTIYFTNINHVPLWNVIIKLISLNFIKYEGLISRTGYK